MGISRVLGIASICVGAAYANGVGLGSGAPLSGTIANSPLGKSAGALGGGSPAGAPGIGDRTELGMEGDKNSAGAPVLPISGKKEGGIGAERPIGSGRAAGALDEAKIPREESQKKISKIDAYKGLAGSAEQKIPGSGEIKRKEIAGGVGAERKGLEPQQKKEKREKQAPLNGIDNKAATSNRIGGNNNKVVNIDSKNQAQTNNVVNNYNSYMCRHGEDSVKDKAAKRIGENGKGKKSGAGEDLRRHSVGKRDVAEREEMGSGCSQRYADRRDKDVDGRGSRNVHGKDVNGRDVHHRDMDKKQRYGDQKKANNHHHHNDHQTNDHHHHNDHHSRLDSRSSLKAGTRKDMQKNLDGTDHKNFSGKNRCSHNLSENGSVHHHHAARGVSESKNKSNEAEKSVRVRRSESGRKSDVNYANSEKELGSKSSKRERRETGHRSRRDACSSHDCSSQSRSSHNNTQECDFGSCSAKKTVKSGEVRITNQK